ncbi:MAG: class I SAM-dependent DNA methyltransferase [Betaproteobacteria bacterium]|nr:class I SAM-dependent DNA methyltransferase [Betaproteobacteria bacterium]
MPLSWNEIRDRALTFSKEWADESSEDAEAKSFWDGFFNVFGVTRRRLASFEELVKRRADKGKTSTGYIDLFWKGQLIVEHKSRGKSLDKAYAQALDYFPGIPERDLPRYILVSDFAHLRLYDLDDDLHWEFPLKDLHKHIKRFGFVAGYAPQVIKPQDPVNIKAAEQMGRLHDFLKAAGFAGHDLEVLLVRLVFCLFADDAGIFPAQGFRDWLENRTAEDGSDLGPQLALLFQVLNTPKDKRQKNLDEQIAAFEYVNGKLFEEALHVASFDAKMRATLLDCCALNWGAVSPAIFGALFQSIMDEKARRNLGAHYTSEENILKLIKPLFLDELWAEFERVKGNKNRLFEFHKKLRSLVFLDPACGCGNFLVITYRELRLLELEVLRAVHSGPGSRFIDIHQELQIDVDQFNGIEIEEWPAQIAQVAMWLVDHQMNQKVSVEFGMYFARIPLKTSPHIVQGNALRLDWNDIMPAERLSYILGNPPFVGSKLQNDSQRAEIGELFARVHGAGVLDYVTGWYLKAARYIQGTNIRCAFVSTNSITQGEQPSLLWPELYRLGIKLHFAHRTFRWDNEARGVAAVHCVIIGFGRSDVQRKIIFEYDDPKGEPHAIAARNINPYLVDAPDVVLPRRDNPLCNVPEIGIGNKPIDGGHYLFTPEEKAQFIKGEPGAAKWFKRWVGSDEFLNGYERWCLWLEKVKPDELRKLPKVMERIEAVRKFRLESKSAPTRKLAEMPTRFHVENIPDRPFLIVPKVSSERRRFIPMGFMQTDTLCSDLVFVVPSSVLFHFGVLSSMMHMAWVRSTCGRLESRYRYSKDIVYNNFPWPEKPVEREIAAIETAAQEVLDARKQCPNASLADLYDPNTMPPALVKAHQALDRAVDAAYGKKSFTSDAERVAFLFDLYQRYTSLPLEVEKGAKKLTRKKQS